MRVVLYRTDKRGNELKFPLFSIDANYMAVDAEFRDNVSMITPTLSVTRDVNWTYGNCTDDAMKEVEYYNYLYIDPWARFYFIDDIVSDGNRLYIYCTEDYLGSWYSTLYEQTFYCERSSNKYDPQLTDTLFPSMNKVGVLNSQITSPWDNIDKGNYVIGIASGDNDAYHIGTNVYYVLTPDEMTDFMSDLMGKADISIEGLVDSLVKCVVNPLQYIRSCYWFPYTLKGNFKSVSKIYFSYYSAEASADVITFAENDDSYTSFEVTSKLETSFFTDNFSTENMRSYQMYPPYSKYQLIAYPFGTFELPTALISQLIDGAQLEARVRIDHISGMGSLQIGTAGGSETVYINTTAQIGIEIPIGEVLQNYAAAALETAGAVTTLAHGSGIGAAKGILNAIDNVVPNPQVQGTAGGYGQLQFGRPWLITRQYTQPLYISNDLQGEPCCSNQTISALDGYAVFNNPECTGKMLKSEKDAINALLARGIFIKHSGSMPSNG